jgi:protoporphyrinogen/coproporphyrinogen III oxidase
VADVTSTSARAARRADPATARVVVVGGGISGLTAALECRVRLGPHAHITVVEAGDRLGGKLRSGRTGGISHDAGAESLLTRRREALALVEDAGLGADVVHPATSGASLWLDGALRPLPAGTVMGVPRDLSALAASGVLSLPGLLRVPLDRVMGPTPFRSGETVDDIAIGELVAARLGREVVDRLVEPLLGGVYAGHADDLSFAATLPDLARDTQVLGSVLAAAERVGARQQGEGPVFATVEGGLGRLPEAVATASGAQVRLGTTATALEASAAGWQVGVSDHDGQEVIHADAVVLSTAAGSTARLLWDVAPVAAAELAAIPYASVALVAFVVPRAALRRRLHGTGFLVPPSEDRVVKAATFASRKWEWVARQDPDVELIRCSVGRHGETHHLLQDDDDLAWAAWGDLASAVDIDGSPAALSVTRWDEALPQYEVGHLDRVARIQEDLAGHAGLAACGAALEGVGIAACVASAQAAAQRALQPLVTPDGTMSS